MECSNDWHGFPRVAKIIQVSVFVRNLDSKKTNKNYLSGFRSWVIPARKLHSMGLLFGGLGYLVKHDVESGGSANKPGL